MGPTRYAQWSAVLCLVVALGLLPLAFQFGPTSVFWGLLGFWMMSLVGIAGGAWMVDRHGSTGPGFATAVAACILARSVLAAVGAGAAALRGMEAVYAFLVGLAGGYFPVQVFEMSWFLKRNKLQS